MGHIIISSASGGGGGGGAVDIVADSVGLNKEVTQQAINNNLIDIINGASLGTDQITFRSSFVDQSTHRSAFVDQVNGVSAFVDQYSHQSVFVDQGTGLSAFIDQISNKSAFVNLTGGTIFKASEVKTGQSTFANLESDINAAIIAANMANKDVISHVIVVDPWDGVSPITYTWSLLLS